ncbi:MAG: PilZ domain-containing protein [Candidatus Binatia bacterium]
MSTKPSEGTAEQRHFTRAPISVPFRLVPRGRPLEAVDGQTLDVSSNGIGVKLRRGRSVSIDELLETLVEDRLSIEVMLRLPEGSVSAEGQLMWWGLLGDDEGFTIRAGILLKTGWSTTDWQLIEKNLLAS